ncbi:RdgB/HAM1 family non-canonical purine NTP pyrophosphatase [Candidatus Woesearchaeota archaeon]|nr:RdgB/HAM1 family non-canonical purine NTP pyrophosphatase [Candidatus Woesearchaeota archaeon]
MKIFFVTGNPDKVREANEMLDFPGFEFEAVKVDLPELQGTPEEVALEKVKIAYEKIKKPVIVDDTGLAFNALNGMPGIYIKHFLSAVGPEGVYRILDGFDDKTGYSLTSIGYCDGVNTEVFIGKCNGTIVPPASKGHGFAKGWDTIFKADGLNGTFAEVPASEKNKISQRRRAFDMLKEYLKKIA